MKNCVKELKKSKLPLVLYGAAEYGKYVKLILDWHNIKIDFVAVDKEYWREGVKFYDFEVLPIEDVLAKNFEMNVVFAFISDDIEEKAERLKKLANVKKCVIFDKQIVLRNISFYLQGGQRCEKEETDILRNFIKSCDIYLQDEETARSLANNWNGEINKPQNLRFIENAIPVVLCANDDFSPYLAVMLQSLLDYTNPQRKYHFIVFQRDFSLKTKECLFNQTLKFPNCAIDFIDVSCALDEIPLVSVAHFSIDAYSRLLIPYWLDKYPKVIYLDSDMIAKADIAELYDLDIRPFCMGAVIGSLGTFVKKKNYSHYLKGVFANLDNWSRYFNSGVLVFDTEKFREKISCADLFRFAIYYPNRYRNHAVDQDVLNIIVKEDYFVLPPRWNYTWHRVFEEKEYPPAKFDTKILHFASPVKPWVLKPEIENNPDVLSYRKYAEKVELFREYYGGEKRYFDFDKLNKKLAECKNVHFMYYEKFTNPTIDFINKHFPRKDNLFLVKRTRSQTLIAQKFPKGENVIEFDCEFLNPKDFVNKKLLFHSLLDTSIVNWLFNNRDLLSRSYLANWGGDIRFAPTDEASTFVRKNIYGICSSSSSMIELIKQKYGCGHKFIDCNFVIFPTHNFKKFVQLRNRQTKNDAVIVQVNVSVHESTLEMLDILSKYKNENILVRTVLSYRSPEFRSKIIDKGVDIFGDKFIFLDKMIPPDDYIEELAKNDVLIINAAIGGGNITTSLMLGKKVFVTSEFQFNRNFLENGLKVFDPSEIKDMSFKEFCEISKETIENNIKKTEEMFSEERKKSDFAKVFDDKCPALNSEVK